MKRKKVFIVLMGVVFILSGCVNKKTDLDKLLGQWLAEDVEIIFYTPDEEEGNSGDAEVIEDNEIQNASYEWYESSQKIVLSYIDGWGDRVNITYKYEFEDDTTLSLTPIEYSDSVKTVQYDEEETIFEKGRDWGEEK